MNMKAKAKQVFDDVINKKIRTIKEITDGFSNENYVINDAYVIRLVNDVRDETISSEHEFLIYEKIANLKLSEKLVFFDRNDGTKITKFVHNTRKYDNTPNNEQIIFVAKALKKLHSSGIKVPFGYQMFNKIKIYKNEIFSEYHIDQKYEAKVIADVRKIFSKDKMVLCHNDLVKNNLLFSFNKLVIIDWEYAAMNNPYFDLASFISENNLNDQQAELFLSKYFGATLNNLKRKKVTAFINFQDILFYYRGYYLFKKRGDIVFKKIALEKFERIKANMKEYE